MTPRAITGLGIVSTVGVGREAFFEAMRAPRLLADQPLLLPESFENPSYGLLPLAEVRSFDPARHLGDKGLRSLDRLTKLLVVAARLALHDAGIKKDNAYVDIAAERVGVCCSNAYGSLEAITEMDRVAAHEDPRYINPAKFPNTVANSAAGYVSIWEELRALNVSVSDGNCGALDAFACADVFLETDRADALLVGGGEAMSEALYIAFRRLGALDAGARLGEGAAFLVFEPADEAAARGARVLAELTGYATAFVAPEDGGEHLIHASREAMSRAILGALDDAGVDPHDLDAVASSVCGLRAFDEVELAALEAIVPSHVPIVAPKFVLGETLGAGGAMGIAAALAWFDGAAPTPRVRGNDAAGRPIRTVLVTSMGFYGNASAVVMRHVAEDLKK